ncbi:MAG: hypothetical protein QXX94_05035 [Candidatus Bathyarchaeia archaeon]
MGRKIIFTLIICLSLIQLSLAYPSINVVKADNFLEFTVSAEAYRYLNISINVERKVEFLSGGYIMINDTFVPLHSAFANASNSIVLDLILIGVPRNYSSNLIYYVAYDNKGYLPMKSAGIDDVFQWLEISFPEPINVSENRTYNFTVTYVFSGLIKKTGEKNEFYALFPLYPGLKWNVTHCNVTVILPHGVSVLRAEYPRDVFINETTSILRNSTSPLRAYANLSSWIRFTSSTFKLLSFLGVIREITVDEWGKITVTEFYELSVTNVDKITLNLPAGATSISVYDAYGPYSKTQVGITNKNNSVIVDITLSEKLSASEKARISVFYSLPSYMYLNKRGWQDYELNIDLTKPDQWIIQKIITTIVLPEGASFLRENHYTNINFERINVLQEKAIIEHYNVTKFESLGVLKIKYQYAPFWASLKPTILSGALIGLVSLIIMLSKPFGRVETVKPILVSFETLKEFIEVFEERERILSEIEFLEQQSKRGKISRKQYKLRRKMLEERLSSVQGRLIALKDEIESAGGRYADMMKRLEMASADIETVKRSISEVEIRYHRGEISAETRRRLLEEYENRRKRSESIVEEILLRLKEEIL